MPHIPKTSRYTLGNKIDDLFLKTIEYALLASYLHRAEKLPLIKQAVVKLDLLKFFLQVAWEIQALDSKKYINLSKLLDEIGKMFGGWFKGIKSKTPVK